MSQTIQGNAGVPGATVALTGTATASVTADGTGTFTFPNLANGPYTVTPTLAGFTFTPTNLAKTIASADILNVNFAAADSSTASNVKDSRGALANATVDIQDTETYVVQIESHLQPVDSRVSSIVPVDSRVAANIPKNSRT